MYLTLLYESRQRRSNSFANFKGKYFFLSENQYRIVSVPILLNSVYRVFRHKRKQRHPCTKKG